MAAHETSRAADATGPLEDEDRVLRRKRLRAARKAELAAREDFFAQARPLTPFLATRVGEELFFVSTEDLGVGRRVFVRSWRKDMTTLAKANARLAELGVSLPEDPVFVDVGANIGTTTVMALRRHPFSAAVALEPSPDNFRLLRLNLTANGLDASVQALPVAAGDRHCEVALDLSRSNHGGHRVSDAAPAGDAVTAECITLDGLVDQGVVDPVRVGLLWIDAPGSEGPALLGAGRLLEAGTPTVVSLRPGLVHPGDPLAELLTTHFTDAVELRKAERRLPIHELTTLSSVYEHKGDVLLVRRA
jgi:FkbM family methyltransferase